MGTPVLVRDPCPPFFHLGILLVGGRDGPVLFEDWTVGVRTNKSGSDP